MNIIIKKFVKFIIIGILINFYQLILYYIEKYKLLKEY